ncbi:MAG: hypothetical protein ACT4PO_13345 [Actinomycetota bacterium]
MISRSFERFAGALAIAIGVGGLGYAVAFVFALRSTPRSADYASALFLLLGGVLGTAVLVALYGRLRDTDRAFALWGLLLGLAGAVGSAVHGGYDLANLVNPPNFLPGGANDVDPRGLLTFGFSALAISIFAWLIVRGNALPRRLGYLGYASAALLVVIYLGRLIVVNPRSPVLLAAALLAGFVVNPAWYIWLGRELMRGGGSTGAGSG